MERPLPVSLTAPSEAERALAEERAASLGIAGDRLELAIVAYERARVAGPLPPGEEAAHLDLIADRLWALQVQRECMGLGADNLAWIQRAYPGIPRAALVRR
ncbi:hypothetical protein FTX61_10690 [Nitriliruptoraceae bacterium ZYF776]|nr:hypothetical protein [Profundirhabdus halotolerans]